MKFTDNRLEVVLRVQPSGDVRVECNSREVVRALGVIKLAGRQAAARLDRHALVQAAQAGPVPVGFEIELLLRPDGYLILRSTSRDTRRVLAALATAARRLEASIHHRRLSRPTLLLSGNHQRVYERV